MNSYLTIVHALSSLHAGTGQGSGVIDLPIAREKATGLPYLPGSSLKGTLRTHCPEDKRAPIFGNENAESGIGSAGTVQISDQRLLLLPVRSLAGTFAWVTSPYVLRRLARDMTDLNVKLIVPEIPIIAPDLKEGWVADGENICQITAETTKEAIYLEEFDLITRPHACVTAWANLLGKLIFPDDAENAGWRRELQGRLCIVHDDLLSFLLKTATEINARIRLSEESKTVATGGLWYEEALPTETILSGLALVTPRTKSGNGTASGSTGLDAHGIGTVLQTITQKNLQLGGKSTTGHGLCRVTLNTLEVSKSYANS